MLLGTLMTKKFFLAIFACVFLAACETVGPSKADISSLSEGKTGAVILDYEEFEDLYSYNIYLSNRDTKELVRLLGSDNSSGWVKGNLAMNTVTPGTYEIISGRLFNSDTAANMPLLKYWFEPFEVKAGELVDMGKLVMERIDVSSIQPHQQGIIGDIIGLKDSERDSTYIVYRFDDVDELRNAKLLEKTPEITSLTRVRRSPTRQFTRVEFESAVLEAYALDADGMPPKEADADKKLAESLEKILSKSR